MKAIIWTGIKMFIFVYALLCIISAVHPLGNYKELKINIHGTPVDKKDTYQCVSIPIDDLEGKFVAGFQIITNTTNIHHLTLGLCGETNSSTTTWDCHGQQGEVCIGPAKNIGGYNGGFMGKSNLTYTYPDDVAIKLGKESGLYNLVAQMHFKKPDGKPSIPGNVTLFLTDSAAMRPNSFETVLAGYIPANSKNFSAETSCKWRGVEVFPYNFRTHTHSRGVYVEGYRIRNGTWTVIGQGGPHIENGNISRNDDGTEFNIVPGDFVASRCVFNNEDDHNVNIGLNHDDEMCAFGIGFKYRAEDEMVYSQPPVCTSSIQEMNWCSHEETKARCTKHVEL